MQNPWKLATIGLALMGTTALGTGLTTAWMMRTPGTATAQETATTPQAAAAQLAPPAPAVRPAVVHTARPVTPVSATPRSAAATTAAQCGTNGDRVMQIAKPGLIGALLGAGAGAATGAIADGGKAAGKGALIGGLAGTAIGAGYGAYKTKAECGTVFND